MTQAGVPQSIYEFTMASGRGNPVVFLDVTIGNDPVRRLRFELYYAHLPDTAENFRQLCTGEGPEKGRKKVPWYKGSNIHRVIPGFMMQGGDITHGNGIGGSSANARIFDDEGFMFKVENDRIPPLIVGKHMPGSLSMAHQANTNKSQFFVCFRECSWLNGKHVVFGQLILEDMIFLKDFDEVGTSSGLPLKPIVIVNAGQLCGKNFADATDMTQEDEDDGKDIM